VLKFTGTHIIVSVPLGRRWLDRLRTENSRDMIPTPGNTRLGTSLRTGLAMELGRFLWHWEFMKTAMATPDSHSVNGTEWIKCIVGQDR
jgi:hypothetical protein